MTSKQAAPAGSAKSSEAERTDPNAACEAMGTYGMKVTECQISLQWLSAVMVGVSVFAHVHN